jgi:4-cresol dehydrogenase (hydroxylating)
LVCERVLAHGFEPAISLTMISGRALACIISLTYDRAIAGEDEKATACYRHLVRVLADHGYHSYRLPAGMMTAMGEAGPYMYLLDGIKHALDPAGILAPGRYVHESRHAIEKSAASGQ